MTIDHYFDSFEDEAFRLEALPSYAVPQEEADLRQFTAGRLAPAGRTDTDWTSFVRDNIARGKRHKRLRIFPDDHLTPYLLFEIEWHYMLAVLAGEDIRLVPESRAQAFDVPGDHWVFDSSVAFEMRYREDGSFISSERCAGAVVAELCKLRDELFTHGDTPQQILAQVRSGQLPIRP